MKKYNGIIGGVIFVYLCLFIFLFIWFQNRDEKINLLYKVEMNEIMMGLEKKGEFSEPDLHGKDYIKEVSFLSVREAQEKEKIKDFYHNRNGKNSLVQPFYIGDMLLGYVRFDYVLNNKNDELLWLMEGVLFLSFVFILLILFYIRNKIIQPFHVLSDMPYELSKGHLHGDLEESRSRLFGKFVWGISMLRDTLNTSKMRELKLEKDKKLLLLSLSHDIKIPLSTIKLYAKALSEGIYDTEEKKIHAAKQIGNHTLEIEEFVKEIITTSSEDILSIEVENSEFYLGDYIDKVKKYYEPKCRLMMLDLRIGRYNNKLLKGDMDRSFEVMENLLENAFKYGDGKEISIDFYEEDYCQIVKVFNTGKLVAVEEIPHLFDSFYRGSNVGDKEGNGLGLYISRQIMRKMDGDMFAERGEDGMSFSLVFRM